jgi:Flp pilus assembly pilin Flp
MKNDFSLVCALLGGVPPKLGRVPEFEQSHIAVAPHLAAISAHVGVEGNSEGAVMMHTLRRFWNDETGAVTVDWVVITAAIVALGVAVTAAVTTGTENLSDSIWAYMDSLDLFSD